ncbi:MAG: S41 family peptidase [Bacteroidota bacterium]
MKKKSSLILSLFVLVFASTIISLFTFFDDTKSFKTAKSLDIFYSLFSELNEQYVNETDPEELISIAIDSMLSSLDPYTKYIPQSKIEEYRIMTHGEYGGIGAILSSQKSRNFISEVYKNSPAQKSGIMPGDIIIKIDNHSIDNKTNEEIHEILQGEPGTYMNIDIKRFGVDSLIHFSIQREKIQISSIPYHGMISSNIGYIKLRSFTQNCSQDIIEAHQELKNKGAESFIIDLRNNPGGLLFEAIQVVNIFVPKNNKIVYTRGKNSLASHDYFTQKEAIDTSSKLIILINEKSASASEIVAGSIQDFDRGIIIGEQSFGKGLVQAQRKIAHNSLLKVTISKYYIPSGRCIQKIDYSHKDSGKKSQSIPDSLLSTFYTKNGRPVKDGGGIVPDVLISDIGNQSNMQKILLKQSAFLHFASTYFSPEDSTKYSPETFTVSEELFQSFVTFVDTSAQLTHTKKQTLIAQLKAESEKDSLNIDFAIKELQETIHRQEKEQLMVEKDALSQILGKEITKYFFSAEGSVTYFLPHDTYIDAAQTYLNTTKYKRIISGIEGTHKK